MRSRPKSTEVAILVELQVMPALRDLYGPFNLPEPLKRFSRERIRGPS